MRTWVMLTLNPFPNTDVSDVSTADNNWKHCDKKKNCSYWAVSSFAVMFSTLFKYYTIVYRGFQYFFLRCFESCLLQNCCMCERLKRIFPVPKNLTPWPIFKFDPRWVLYLHMVTWKCNYMSTCNKQNYLNPFPHTTK